MSAATDRPLWSSPLAFHRTRREPGISSFGSDADVLRRSGIRIRHDRHSSHDQRIVEANACIYGWSRTQSERALAECNSHLFRIDSKRHSASAMPRHARDSMSNRHWARTECPLIGHSVCRVGHLQDSPCSTDVVRSGRRDVLLVQLAEKLAAADEHAVFAGRAPFESDQVFVLASVAGHFDRDIAQLERAAVQ